MQSPLLLSLPLQGSVLGRQYYLQGYMDMYFNNWIQIQVSQKACRKDPFERNDFVKNNLHASQCIGTNNTQIFSQLPVRTNTGKVVLIDSVILWQPCNHHLGGLLSTQEARVILGYMSSNCVCFFCAYSNLLCTSIGTSRSNDATATRTSRQRQERRLKSEFAFFQSLQQSFIPTQVNPPEAEFQGTKFKLRKRNKILLLLVYVLHKMQYQAFSRRSHAETGKKCTKKCDAHAKLLFC